MNIGYLIVTYIPYQQNFNSKINWVQYMWGLYSTIKLSQVFFKKKMQYFSKGYLSESIS